MDRAGRNFGNFFGAFADGAILFPLIATLSTSSGYSSSVLFISTGLLYIFAGIVFRIPMPVQPLKAVAIAAVVSGASFSEVRIAGGLLGGFCLLFLLFRVDKFASRIPTYFVHGIQLGLGLLLIRRAIEMFIPTISLLSIEQGGMLLGFFCACWVLSRISGIPTLGFLAAGGALIGIAKSHPSVHPTQLSSSFRWEMVVALALPQLVLTSANSVIATRDVALRYFGLGASRVTLCRLLAVIGMGNILMAAIGGLPFCHGSGGMTAHVRGGSTTFTSNIVIGGFLLGLAILQMFIGQVELNYPPLLLAILLAMVGLFHIQLAAPTWKVPGLRPVLISMAAASTLTQNLIYGLIAGLLIVSAMQLKFKRRALA